MGPTLPLPKYRLLNSDLNLQCNVDNTHFIHNHNVRVYLHPGVRFQDARVHVLRAHSICRSAKWSFPIIHNFKVPFRKFHTAVNSQ